MAKCRACSLPPSKEVIKELRRVIYRRGSYLKGGSQCDNKRSIHRQKKGE